MGAVQMGAHVIQVVCEGLASDVSELDYVSELVSGHLRETRSSQVAYRCFYVDLYRAASGISGQPDNRRLQLAKARVVRVIQAHMFDLADCRYNLGPVGVLDPIVDSLVTPVDWTATRKIFNTLLNDSHVLLNSLAHIEQAVTLELKSLLARLREAHCLITNIRCACTMFKRYLPVD